MNGPATNGLHGYKAGWLTMLLKMGVASEKALHEPQNCVAQVVIAERHDGRGRPRQERKRRRRESWPRGPSLPLFRGPAGT